MPDMRSLSHDDLMELLQPARDLLKNFKRARMEKRKWWVNDKLQERLAFLEGKGIPVLSGAMPLYPLYPYTLGRLDEYREFRNVIQQICQEMHKQNMKRDITEEKQ